MLWKKIEATQFSVTTGGREQFVLSVAHAKKAFIGGTLMIDYATDLATFVGGYIFGDFLEEMVCNYLRDQFSS